MTKTGSLIQVNDWEAQQSRIPDDTDDPSADPALAQSGLAQPGAIQGAIGQLFFFFLRCPAALQRYSPHGQYLVTGHLKAQCVCAETVPTYLHYSPQPGK